MPSSNLLLASKIIVVEEPPRIRNIQGVETSVTGFIGVTERGPVRTPVFVTSFEEAVNRFGGFISNSDLMIAVEAFFRNGGTAAWIVRVVHYVDVTDPLTATAVKGEFDINDRGGAATAASIDSATGPFNLEDGEVLEVNVDGAGADTLTINAAPASVSAANTEPFALVDGDTLEYRVKLPGSPTLGELKTITFNTADFASIAAATAEEVANVINRDGLGIKALLTTGDTSFDIVTDKKGSDAELLINGGTAIAVGKLNIPAGTQTGTGNVADVTITTAAELAALLTALPLTAGTATAAGNVLTITGVTTGVGGSVVITANTTALGIFAGVLPITVNGSAAGLSPTIRVLGRDPGTYIEDYVVQIQAATSGDADRFNLLLTQDGRTVEAWPNLSMDDTDSRYVETFIAANSGLIDVVDLNSAAISPNNLPEIGTFSVWSSADDGLTGLVDADFIGSDAGDTGFYALDEVDNLSVLVVPGRATSAVHNAMLAYCEVHRGSSCFAILDPPEGLSAQQMKAYVETTATLLNSSEFGAIYWPRVKILNPSTAEFGNEEQIVVAPSGHIAGAYARTDGASPGGVYNAPAGVDEGRLFGVLGFETVETLDERKRDVVYPSRINPITVIRGSSPHIDGSRSLRGNSNFPSVPERRGVIFIEQSIKESMLFAKHRNNTRSLRMQVRRTIEGFLLRQFDNGAFRGDTPAESFFVDVGDSLNTPEVIFANQLKVRIGLATNKPTEFIVLLFSQDTRALEERIASQTV